MPPFRLTSVLRLCTVVALLLSGCSLLPAVSGAPSFGADLLVGADTWSFTDLTLRPSVQQALYARDALDVLTAYASQAGVDPHRLPTPSGSTVDFERDVLPRLDGEVALAVAGPSDHTQVTLLIHTNDIEGILRLQATKPQPVLTKDARGVTRLDGAPGTTFTVGYKGWIVSTNHAPALDQVLDRIDGKGTPSLASQARYRSAVEHLSGDRIGYGYLDVSPLMERVSPANAQVVEALQAARGRMAYSFGFDAGPAPGVRSLGMRLEYLPDAMSSRAKAVGGDALEAMDRLPKASMLAVAGSELSSSTDRFPSLATDQELGSTVRALLSAFAGPYGFAVTPPSVQKASGTGQFNQMLGGVFVIAKLAPGADVDELTAAVTTLVEGSGLPDASSGWQQESVVDQNWLAVNAVAAPMTLDTVPQDMLASDRVYQWVRPGFVQDGYNLYLNVDALVAVLGIQRPMAAFFEPNPIRAIGASVQTDQLGASHARIQVLIASK